MAAWAGITPKEGRQLKSWWPSYRKWRWSGSLVDMPTPRAYRMHWDSVKEKLVSGIFWPTACAWRGEETRGGGGYYR